MKKIILFGLVFFLMIPIVSAVKVNETPQFCGDEDTDLDCVYYFTGSSGNEMFFMIQGDERWEDTKFKYAALNDDRIHFANFSVTFNETATITGVTLITEFDSDTNGYGCGVDGPGYVQFRNDNNGSGWFDTTIEPVDGEETQATFDLFAIGVNSIAEIRDLDIAFTNCDRGGGDDMFFDYFFLEVEFTDNGWKDSMEYTNLTEIDMLGGSQTQTLEIVEELNITTVDVLINMSGCGLAEMDNVLFNITSPSGTTQEFFNGSRSLVIVIAGVEAYGWYYHGGWFMQENFEQEATNGTWTFTYWNSTVANDCKINETSIRFSGYNVSVGEPPEDTCTPPGAGDWNVDCSDNCNWGAGPYSVPGNMYITGAGVLTLSDTMEFTGAGQYITMTTGCHLNIESGGKIIG